MNEDFEAQEDELLALASIYSREEFVRAESASGGEIRVSVDLPRDFSVTVKHGDKQREYGISFLPPLLMTFDLPVDYPSTSPPSFTLSCRWLSLIQLSAVCQHLDELWQGSVGNVVLFYWVQFLQEDLLNFLHIQPPLEIPVYNQTSPTSEDYNNQTSPTSEDYNNQDAHKSEDYNKEASPKGSQAGGGLEGGLEPLDPRAALSEETPDLDLLAHLLDYDESQRQRVFEGQPYGCGICFLDRSGSECVQFRVCGHVYCNTCMAEYFKVQIRDGNVRGLTCPESECSSTATPSQVKHLVGEELFARYDRLLLQSTLDRMADVVYCPRHACGAAVILEPDTTATLCLTCHYAFCSLCRRSYHGPSHCQAKWAAADTNGSHADVPQAEAGLKALWEDYASGSDERRKFLEKRYGKHTLQLQVEECLNISWMRQNSKECPRCSASIEKNGGCNKMDCTNCGQYFCWVCLICLPTNKPFEHFNNPNTACYNKPYAF